MTEERKDGPELTVRIGAEELHYEVWWTQAPPAYDGFGTITISKCSAGRLVLISPKAKDWQLSRYSSGLHTAWPGDETDYERAIETLFERLAVWEG